ncbi:MAG: COP23 domain-containing protein [Dolichospermum sp.]
MKTHRWISLFAVASVLGGLGETLINSPVLAQNQGIKFVCTEVNQTPVTFSIRNRRGKQVIRWIDTMGSGKDTRTPKDRCIEVTERLNTHFSQGGQYITHGTINRQPVICLTNEEGGSCQHLLLTLDYREDDPKQKLEDWVRANDNNFSGRPLREGCPTYIDINAYMAGKTKFAKEVCQ